MRLDSTAQYCYCVSIAGMELAGETEMHTELGTGQLSWPGEERRGDRYGLVGLFNAHDEPIGLAPLPEYQRAVLWAVIVETRKSPHIGDLFRGFAPSTPDVGDVIKLGEGEPFYSERHGQVGLIPDDGRDIDWLNPEALYRCHQQTVRLILQEKI